MRCGGWRPEPLDPANVINVGSVFVPWRIAHSHHFPHFFGWASWSFSLLRWRRALEDLGPHHGPTNLLINDGLLWSDPKVASRWVYQVWAMVTAAYDSVRDES